MVRRFPVSAVLVAALFLSLAGALAPPCGGTELVRRQAEARLRSHLAALAPTGNKDVVLQRAQIGFFLGQLIGASDEKEALALYRAGYSAASSVLERDPDDASAVLWRSVNRLGIMRLEPRLSHLFRITGLRDELLRLAAADPGFEYAAADRVLAMVYHRAPRIVSIGDSRKAEQHFRRALEIAPLFPANTLLYAEFLADEGRCDDAWRHLTDSGVAERFGDYPLYELLWILDFERIERMLAACDQPAAGTSD